MLYEYIPMISNDNKNGFGLGHESQPHRFLSFLGLCSLCMLPRNHARQHDGVLDLKELGHWSSQRHDFWLRHKELVVAESLISCALSPQELG